MEPKEQQNLPVPASFHASLTSFDMDYLYTGLLEAIWLSWDSALLSSYM